MLVKVVFIIYFNFNFKFELQINKFRLQLGISQEQLSIKSGISQSYISKLESLDRIVSPTLTTLCSMGKAFGICPLRLIKCNIDCTVCPIKFQ